MNFPDVTIPPETDHRKLLDTLQRFFNAAMPFWRNLGSASSGTAVDHGLLSGLTDDDHTQYLNTARHTAIAGDHVTNGDSHDHVGGDGAQIHHGGTAGLADDDHTQYVLADGTRNVQYSSSSWKIGNVSGGHYSQFEADGTLVFTGNATVWDDVRVTPGSFDRPGTSDPTLVTYTPGGTGTATYLWEFKKNDIASFTVQIPHGYKAEENIYVHVHWNPREYGATESGNTVGWKIDYTWANIDGTFGAMATADLSDACAGVDHAHQMTPEVALTGTGKHISSMLLCNIKRTDTGADDTWAGTASGQLPLLLEIDFHFPMDTVGSRSRGTK